MPKLYNTIIEGENDAYDVWVYNERIGQIKLGTINLHKGKQEIVKRPCWMFKLDVCDTYTPNHRGAGWESARRELIMVWLAAD